jgi:hypothetical protein
MPFAGPHREELHMVDKHRADAIVVNDDTN